jgi:hypothetical protein
VSGRGKPAGEQAFRTVRLARRRALRHRSGPWSRKAHLLRRIRRDTIIPAGRAVSPAARLLIETGAVFDIGCDHLLVAESHRSGIGPQANVLILRGTDYNDGDVRAVVRAIQVRDLETLIEEGVIDIAFGPNARDYNRSRGWSRNGAPTLASLGIDPWR